MPTRSFKEYNDSYGHLVGDECLRQIGTILKTIVIRITDMVARYVTVSLGVITVYPQRLEAPEQVVALADEALYSAKKGGRNRTEVALDKTLFLLYGIK